MTLRLNHETGIYEADIRDRVFGRVHLSLRTKRKGEATDRYSAVRALVREGDPELVFALRKRKLRVEAVWRCHRDRLPFSSLKTAASWPTLGTAVKEYTAWLEATHKAANTIRNAKHYLGAAEAFFGADTLLEQITGERVEAFAAAQRERGLVGWSGAQFLVRLSALFRWLVRREEKRAREAKRATRLLHNPVDPEIVPKQSEPKARFLSADEVTRVMAATPGAYRFAVAAGVLAGLRIGELVHLRPALDVDLEHGLIMVQEREGWQPKGGMRREVPMPAELLAIARRHLERYASPHYMMPSPYAADGDVPMTDETVNEHFERIVTDAGLVYGRKEPLGVTYHTLRHTFASHLVMDGVDLKTVSRLMGHTTTKQVEKTYGHLSPEHRRAAVQRLGARLHGAFMLEEEAA